MYELTRAALNGFTWFILGYFLVLNTIYLVIAVLAAVDFFKYFRRTDYHGFDEVFANPLSPGVSLIVAAYNEEAGISDNVRAMLSLRYPLFEVIVVDDGSTDNTFEVLKSDFDLVEVPPYRAPKIETIGKVTSVWITRSGEPLVVVRKENARRRADATNAGLNNARFPLVCVADADSILEADSLLRVVKPFVDDPDRVVATGGVIRPVNGNLVHRGTVETFGLPKNWLARIQVIEYLRAFLMGRTGWSAIDGLLIISGAFGVFRKDIVMELGGFDTEVLGEDAEMVARMHRHFREQRRRDYKIVFISEPVCWTEVPTSLPVLARQRKRWAQGLVEVLWKHKRMMFNPRYGRIGMLVAPYQLFFEVLGPVVELFGFATMVIGVPLGLIEPETAALFFVAAVGYGVVLSLAALAIEEFSFHRLNSYRDLWWSMVVCVVENIGYRQLHAWWRLVGLCKFIAKRESTWGVMTRTGFDKRVEPAALPPAGREKVDA